MNNQNPPKPLQHNRNKNASGSQTKASIYSILDITPRTLNKEPQFLEPETVEALENLKINPSDLLPSDLKEDTDDSADPIIKIRNSLDLEMKRLKMIQKVIDERDRLIQKKNSNETLNNGNENENKTENNNNKGNNNNKDNKDNNGNDENKAAPPENKVAPLKIPKSKVAEPPPSTNRRAPRISYNEQRKIEAVNLKQQQLQQNTSNKDKCEDNGKTKKPTDPNCNSNDTINANKNDDKNNGKNVGNDSSNKKNKINPDNNNDNNNIHEPDKIKQVNNNNDNNNNINSISSAKADAANESLVRQQRQYKNIRDKNWQKYLKEQEIRMKKLYGKTDTSSIDQLRKKMIEDRQFFNYSPPSSDNNRKVIKEPITPSPDAPKPLISMNKKKSSSLHNSSSMLENSNLIKPGSIVIPNITSPNGKGLLNRKSRIPRLRHIPNIIQ